MRTKVMAGIAAVLLLSACGSGDSGNEQGSSNGTPSSTPTGSDSTPTSEAAPVQFDSPCDVLTADQAREALQAEKVSSDESNTTTSQFQACQYRVDGTFLFSTLITTGMLGDDGQKLAESAVTRDGGQAEPIDDLAAGAAYAKADSEETKLAMAYPDGDGGMTLVTIQGKVNRSEIEKLARAADSAT